MRRRRGIRGRPPPSRQRRPTARGRRCRARHAQAARAPPPRVQAAVHCAAAMPRAFAWEAHNNAYVRGNGNGAQASGSEGKKRGMSLSEARMARTR